MILSAFVKSRNPCLTLSINRAFCQNVTETPASFVDGEVSEEINRPPSFFNKSRLLPQHRRLLMGEKPYDEPKISTHLTEKYQRKMFGKYGLKSDVDPRICFPTKDDIKQREEYEKVAYPYTLKQMMEKVALEKEAKEEQIQKREADIAKKLEKLEQWKAELNAKIAKKESAALAAKEKKERLIEEVRRHFGFTVDPRDDRFKELLEKKEKEDRKQQKEAKRKIKEDKMMTKLLETTKQKEEQSVD